MTDLQKLYNEHPKEDEGYEDYAHFADALDDYAYKLEVACDELEKENKELKCAWHNLRKNPNDLPKLHEQVIVNVKGTDVIFPKPNESWRDAMVRCQKEATPYSTLAWLDNDDGDSEIYWCNDGYPMVVLPRAWKYIEELKDEGFEDEE